MPILESNRDARGSTEHKTGSRCMRSTKARTSETRREDYTSQGYPNALVSWRCKRRRKCRLTACVSTEQHNESLHLPSWGPLARDTLSVTCRRNCR